MKASTTYPRERPWSEGITSDNDRCKSHERWGVEFLVVQADRGLLGLVEKRVMWPDAARRLCTSTLKRDKITPLFKQITDALGLDWQAMILSALGIRAAESPARAKKQPLAIDMRASNGQRMVLTWHPILEPVLYQRRSTACC
ncbi:hypothetical protein AB0O57_27885 [Streptomyces sp. NPDC091201]|uniref:hypothetical protein n=1 Tax=Streptomyces sp. NPDC091201 TaxID=3155190 RepID=UPI00342E895D